MNDMLPRLLLLWCASSACWGPLDVETNALPISVHDDVVVSGGWQTLCLIERSELRCWDLSRFPALQRPRIIPGRWRTVSAGQGLVCAIDADQALWCWGRNASGILGQQVPPSGTDTPVSMDRTQPWVSVAAGAGYACAIRDDETMSCTGGTDEGVEAPAPAPDRSALRVIPGRFVFASSNWYSTTALATDGTVWSAHNDDLFQQQPLAGAKPVTNVLQGVLATAALSDDAVELRTSIDSKVISIPRGALVGLGYHLCHGRTSFDCMDPTGFLGPWKVELPRPATAVTIAGHLTCWRDDEGTLQCSRRGTTVTLPR